MSGSSVPEAARAAAIGAVERQVRYVKAIRWTDVAGNWDVEFAADRLMALADAEVAAAVAEERATTRQRIEALEAQAAAVRALCDEVEERLPQGFTVALLRTERVRAALASPGEES